MDATITNSIGPNQGAEVSIPPGVETFVNKLKGRKGKLFKRFKGKGVFEMLDTNQQPGNNPQQTRLNQQQVSLDQKKIQQQKLQQQKTRQQQMQANLQARKAELQKQAAAKMQSIKNSKP
jgi:hypothetical protein